ncbi:helix-turn-helix domain-containing protein [Streptomyces albus subsp. chlorinus]|uniref:helix-turn-helix domain-containing protein n=1 Tax=Streptomyces albus TaxID=1888 RepID=UPI00156EA19D|nr:helix-turn-helix transcriptional regulator [Streptomyces albus]NSC24536.1 helix-turn-helix domain-containing protein [Streptomyces albus subsp. chlorinus]
MSAILQPSGEPLRGAAQEQPNGPTALRIILGVKLRRLRQALDISREDAGRAIRGSHAKITRLERGQVGAKERDLRDLLTLYGIHDPREREEFFDLARQANSPGWWYQYSDVLEDWFELHLGLEDAASMIRTYEVQFLPGLLQTEDYAYALSRLGYPNTEPRKVARIVALRMARQKLLHRADPPHLWAVVDEAVVRRPFGGAEVMREQLEHLLELVRLPHITLQVAPFEVTAAAAGTPVTLLRFADPDLPDKVYLEHLTNAVYLDKPSEIDQYTLIMDRLCAEAFSPAETIGFIEELLDELR